MKGICCWVRAKGYLDWHPLWQQLVRKAGRKRSGSRARVEWSVPWYATDQQVSHILNWRFNRLWLWMCIIPFWAHIIWSQAPQFVLRGKLFPLVRFKPAFSLLTWTQAAFPILSCTGTWEHTGSCKCGAVLDQTSPFHVSIAVQK